MPTLRPVVSYYGGKYRLTDRLIELFPDHNTYVEPFGGAASVLLNKEPSKVEVYNDLNTDLTNLFHCIRDCTQDFMVQVSLFPYSEKAFLDACERLTKPFNGDHICPGRAAAYFVVCRQSFASKCKTWSWSLHRSRRGMADCVSRYLSAIDENLPAVIDRIRKVIIVGPRPASGVMREWDSKDTFFYLDPPYVPTTRTSPKVYEHEMTIEQHEQLLDTITDLKGKVMISGYSNPLYDEVLQGWRKESFEIANHAAGGKTKRRMLESVWMNYD